MCCTKEREANKIKTVKQTPRGGLCFHSHKRHMFQKTRTALGGFARVFGGGNALGREAFGTRVVYLIAVTRGRSRKLQTRPLSEHSLVGAS